MDQAPVLRRREHWRVAGRLTQNSLGTSAAAASDRQPLPGFRHLLVLAIAPVMPHLAAGIGAA